MYEPQIGDMYEGVVEGGEDARNAKNELAYSMSTPVRYYDQHSEHVSRTITSEGAEGDVLLGGGGSLFGRHCDCAEGGLLWMEYGRGKESRRRGLKE